MCGGGGELRPTNAVATGEGATSRSIGVFRAEFFQDRGDPRMGQIEDVGQEPLGDTIAAGDEDHQVAAELPATPDAGILRQQGRTSGNRARRRPWTGGRGSPSIRPFETVALDPIDRGPACFVGPSLATSPVASSSVFTKVRAFSFPSRTRRIISFVRPYIVARPIASNTESGRIRSIRGIPIQASRPDVIDRYPTEWSRIAAESALRVRRPGPSEEYRNAQLADPNGSLSFRWGPAIGSAIGFVFERRSDWPGVGFVPGRRSPNWVFVFSGKRVRSGVSTGPGTPKLDAGTAVRPSVQAASSRKPERSARVRSVSGVYLCEFSVWIDSPSARRTFRPAPGIATSWRSG